MVNMQIPLDRLHINNNTRPLIFIGSNIAMAKYLDVCDDHGIQVHGIIDQDYFGNTAELHGLPVIGSEAEFENPERLAYYRANFNFFCATNWTPIQDPVYVRNRQKRDRQLELIEQLELDVISLQHRLADVSKRAIIGRGVFIDSFVCVECNCEIHDWAALWSHAIIGHDTVIGRNCVLQRRCNISSHATFEPDVYFGLEVKQFKQNVIFGHGTFVHEGVCIKRGTVANEIVSFAGQNQRRVYDLLDQ